MGLIQNALSAYIRAMDGSSIGKLVILLGLGIVGLGAVIWGMAKVGFSCGRLPGDMLLSKGKFALYFPLVTSLILSLFLTIVINLVIWLFKR